MQNKTTIEELMNHPLYKREREAMQEVTFDQIVKGFEKYGEPLTAANWSSQQLIRHAREELADASQYLTALEERILFLESYIQGLRGKLDDHSMIFEDELTHNVMAAVKYEREKQVEQHGKQRHFLGTWLKILVEEVGEVAAAMQFGENWSKASDKNNLFDELVQVAAVAVAIAEHVLEVEQNELKRNSEKGLEKEISF